MSAEMAQKASPISTCLLMEIYDLARTATTVLKARCRKNTCMATSQLHKYVKMGQFVRRVILLRSLRIVQDRPASLVIMTASPVLSARKDCQMIAHKAHIAPNLIWKNQLSAHQDTMQSMTIQRSVTFARSAHTATSII